MAKKNRTPGEYIEGILRGDRVLLGQAITLIESRKEEHQVLAQSVIEGCLAHSGKSFRIGVTGSPGVGKSTFIDSFGSYLTKKQGRKLAVLAIDPSSQLTKGSILGDKTRMEKLSADAHAFIRPSPAGSSLGGVAQRTREAMLLCEAAGFDTIFIETVGVGQSETAVHGMVDFFLLLLLPGAGDELQGIKRGIVEMADLVAINKADGEREKMAKTARREYARALHLFPAKESGWAPEVVACSATGQTGLHEIWDIMERHRSHVLENGWLEKSRREQARHWFQSLLSEQMHHYFFQKGKFAEQMQKLEKEVLKGKLSPARAVRELMGHFAKPH